MYQKAKPDETVQENEARQKESFGVRSLEETIANFQLKGKETLAITSEILALLSTQNVEIAEILQKLELLSSANNIGDWAYRLRKKLTTKKYE